jgi:hypothetical protein
MYLCQCKPLTNSRVPVVTVLGPLVSLCNTMGGLR